jgi:hypothetical protein
VIDAGKCIIIKVREQKTAAMIGWNTSGWYLPLDENASIL